MKTPILITLLSVQSLFALVSIIPAEIGKEVGFSNIAEASLETTRGNTDTDSYKASYRSTYDNGESFVTWAEASGAYGKANGDENTNKAFAHARYIHAITRESVRAEVFTQYQNDMFMDIKNKVLYGTGARFKILDQDRNARGYLGLGVFHESISYRNPLINPSEENVRLNSYFSYSIDLNNKTSVAYALYFQPKVDNVSDNIQSHEFELKVNIYGDIFLKFNIAYTMDSQPPINIKQYDFTQNTSFVVEF
ncbi:MAG: DUF481 domain-containing protein [Campylobacterota bacterium]